MDIPAIVGVALAAASLGGGAVGVVFKFGRSSARFMTHEQHAQLCEDQREEDRLYRAEIRSDIKDVNNGLRDLNTQVTLLRSDFNSQLADLRVKHAVLEDRQKRTG